MSLLFQSPPVIPPWIQVLQAVVTLGAAIAGAAWAGFKLWKRREHAPRIEFTVDVSFVGVQGGQWIVELLAFVDNKGLVQHVIHEFSFDLRILEQDDPIREGGSKINHQVDFFRLVRRGAWIPRDWESTFIEPGLRTRYSFVATVPSAATFALIHGRFEYGPPGMFHTADKLVRVPPAETSLRTA